jgi:membrane protease subunit HflC
MIKAVWITIGIIVGSVIVIALVNPFFTVMEGEQAVVMQFGKIVRVEKDAGLKLKVPFVETVTKYSKKVQSWDGSAQLMPTAENQLIWVDVTARWKITDPRKFSEALVTMSNAQGRLDDILDSTVRKIIARYPLSEAVRDSNVISEIKRTNVFASLAGSAEAAEGLGDITAFAEQTFVPIQKGRRALSQEMVAEAGPIMPQFGIELIDVVIRQIKYSDQLTQSVYDRMIKERNQIAQAFRSDGAGEKAKWMGQMQRELAQITSDAERKAKEIKARADAQALAIRNAAYSQDAEFADYWMALQAYQALLPKFASKTLTTDADFFKYLYNRRGR